ncbi:MAG: alanine--tRNA ligase-related protein [Promethearchaeota archaeon]
MDQVALYLEDMYMKEFEAKVISVKDKKYIVLDKTAFYPKSGGVDCDLGVLKRGTDLFNVIYVGKFGGKISHEVDKDGDGLQVGDKIFGKLDWDRRYRLMKYHTAAHILSGAFYKNLGAKITGNNLTVEKGRIDFNIENFNRILIEEQVENSNRIIKEDFKVEIYSLDRDEVDRDPGLTKLAMGLSKSINVVRIVDIKGFDRQPDGGCHVRSTTEIGKIKIQKLVNKGKNNRRLYFKID